jgi:biotin carboxyl carrier protein
MEQEEKNNIELVDFAVTARKYKTTLTKKFINRKVWEKVAEGELRAFLPGKILRIDVKKGQTVKAGTLLLIHEAMKMQNRIVAPFNGKVVELYVKTGDQVSKDAPMILIE